MKYYIYLTLFICTFSFNNTYAYSLENNNKLNEELVGFYKSKKNGKMFFLRDESASVKKIEGVDFLEIKFADKSTLFKYKQSNGEILLNSVAPTEKNEDLNLLFKFCKCTDFKNTHACKNSEYRYIKTQKDINTAKYRLAAHKYLSRYIKDYNETFDSFTIHDLSKKLPQNIKNTKVTSASVVYKTHKPIEIDYVNEKESLWFLSLGDNTVNIYINGLDFRNADTNKNTRHAKHKKNWSKYYRSYVFRDDFNIVYSWDSSLGITRKNTEQLVNLIAFILKNNKNNTINLIAHSHGGNLAKKVLVDIYDKNINTKNIKLITLATPHKGIDTIDYKSMLFLPAVEIAYDIFSLNLNTPDQSIQAIRRLYNGTYKQMSTYKENKYLQKLNTEFIQRRLNENAIFIAGKHDNIVKDKSSLFKGVHANRARVNNSHSNIVVSPDKKIFKIIQELK